MKQFAIYFMTNWTNKILYVGVTSNLEQRVWQHKSKIIEGFTKKYNTDKLVYFEQYEDSENAIKREKQIKNWSRKKKDILVNQMNPDWKDLSQKWYSEDPSTSLGMTETKFKGI
ncbi:MAG: GIY-YIG nuclease family protein [Alphaproteobacteria bacterium]|jgi:putative endonuclease|nr:GIY-YIG nuclease family protein [Alphaproteobacteria bacterium]